MIRAILYTSIIILFLVSCSSNNNNKLVIATVGNTKIYNDDFITNYEFGFASVKKGKTTSERKLSYLNKLINEKLLALEGFEHNIQNTEEFKFAEDQIGNELLLEQFINLEIKPRIKITNDELREAVLKSKVKFKVEYWSEKNDKNLDFLKQEFKKTGFNQTIDKLVKQNKEIDIPKHYFESGYITYQDVSPEVFEILRNMEIDEVSEPNLIDGVYYFYKIKDIKRESVTEQEILDKSPSFRKVLYNQYLQTEIISFVDSLLTPKNITTKKEAFEIFYNVVKDWLLDKDYSKQKFETYLSSDIQNPCKTSYINSKDLTIVKSTDGELSISQLQEIFHFNKLIVDSTNIYNLKPILAEMIAISVRDKYLLDFTKQKFGGLKPEYKHQFSKWRDKFAYQIYTKQYFDTAITKEYLESLKNKYQVDINIDALNSIEISETEKSKNITLNVYKNGSSRMAEPIVDASWSNFN